MGRILISLICFLCSHRHLFLRIFMYVYPFATEWMVETRFSGFLKNWSNCHTTFFPATIVSLSGLFWSIGCLSLPGSFAAKGWNLLGKGGRTGGGPTSLRCNALFGRGLRPLCCCDATLKVLHSHILSGNTREEKWKKGGVTVKVGLLHWIFLNANYLYTYTVFQTVMDRSACDWLMSKHIKI